MGRSGRLPPAVVAVMPQNAVSDRIEAARIVMERKYRSTEARDSGDVAAFYVDHSKYLSRYLARCHRALLADARLV